MDACPQEYAHERDLNKCYEEEKDKQCKQANDDQTDNGIQLITKRYTGIWDDISIVTDSWTCSSKPQDKPVGDISDVWSCVSERQIGWTEKWGIVYQCANGMKRWKGVSIYFQTTHTISHVSTRQALSRYHYQRLLNRRKGVYTLSDTGYQRLEYLREIMEWRVSEQVYMRDCTRFTTCILHVYTRCVVDTVSLLFAFCDTLTYRQVRPDKPWYTVHIRVVSVSTQRS